LKLCFQAPGEKYFGRPNRKLGVFAKYDLLTK
jgi:hypothetical protein